MITLANIRKAIYCLNKRLDLLEGGEYSNTVTELSNKVATLESLLDDDALNPTAAIDKFNEIVAFLDSINNTETLLELLRDVILLSYQQNYVTVPTYASLPATGSADTIYRVSNYNGSTNQIDTTSYSEYVWDNSDYTLLCVKSLMSEVFDISAYHATGGTLATYSDLSAALDSNNGGGVPQSFQKGGMRIQFVRTSDNKYVQARCMAQNFTTDVTYWQGVDDEPTAGSQNLVKSGGVANNILAIMLENKGNNISTEYAYKFLVKGKCYRLDVLTKIWDMSTTTYPPCLIYIRKITDNSVVSTLYSKSKDDFSLSDYYLFTAPTEYDCYLDIQTRGDVGSKAKFVLGEDISNILYPVDTNSLITGKAVYDQLYSKIFGNVTIFQMGTIGSDGREYTSNYVMRSKYSFEIPKNEFRILAHTNLIKAVIPSCESVIMSIICYNSSNTFISRTDYLEVNDTAFTVYQLPPTTKYVRLLFNPLDENNDDIDITDVFDYISKHILSLLEFEFSLLDPRLLLSFYKEQNLTNEQKNTALNNLGISFDAILKEDGTGIIKTGDLYNFLKDFWAKCTVNSTTISSNMTVGTWNPNTGNTPTASTGIRAWLLIEVSESCNIKITIPNNFLVSLYYVDSSNKKVGDAITSAWAQGVYMVSNVSGEYNIMVNIKYGNDDNITTSMASASPLNIEYIYNDIVGFIPAASDDEFQELKKETAKNVSWYNADKQPLISSLSKKHLQNWRNFGVSKYFTFIHITDTHAINKEVLRAIEYLNEVPDIDMLVHTGDIQRKSFNDVAAVGVNDIERFIEYINTSQKPVLIALGNHDQNGSNDTNNPVTLQGIYNRFMAPMVTKGWLTAGTNIDATNYATYYYKDFSDYNIRFIVLNSFDPLYDGYYTDRGMDDNYTKYSQAQIDFLISALNNTPSGYHIVLALHTPYDSYHQVTIVNSDWSSTQKTDAGVHGGGQPILLDGNPMLDILKAYKEKSSLTKTYTYTESAVQTEIGGISVNVDFSEVNGIIACIVIGHNHDDWVGNFANYADIKCVCMPGSILTEPDSDLGRGLMGGQDEWKSPINVLEGKMLGKSQDAINAYIVNTDMRRVYVVRIGADFTLDARERNVTYIDY